MTHFFEKFCAPAPQGLHAPQGLQARFPAQGLQPRFAAQGLHPRFAAQGLHPRFAAQGLQPRFPAQGLHPRFGAQGLQAACTFAAKPAPAIPRPNATTAGSTVVASILPLNGIIRPSINIKIRASFIDASTHISLISAYTGVAGYARHFR